MEISAITITMEFHQKDISNIVDLCNKYNKDIEVFFEDIFIVGYNYYKNKYEASEKVVDNEIPAFQKAKGRPTDASKKAKE